MKRRTFIQSTALAIAGTSLVNSAFADVGSKYKNKVGLQLYSLRDVIFKDSKAVLKSVSEFGYKELETFGYKDGKLFGMTVKEYGDYVKSLGMKTISGHYGIDLLDKDWDKTCGDAKSLGQQYVVVPWLNKEYYSSLDVLKKTCASINKGAEVAKKNGLRMGYHNHAFEFEQVEGQVILDVMLKELDPKLVSFEMDIFWVVNAGQDPIAYFEKYPGRFTQWHVKDMDKSDKNRNADVGTGTIDWKKIFAASKKSGMEHFYIEQETYPNNSTESIKNSIKNLLGIV
jgi:sugar phosphate isomerase/epimerase